MYNLLLCCIMINQKKSILSDGGTYLKFRKINDTTINCIITQDDLKKHGIDLDDLFDRKKNAVEFIKRIILKAASSVNMNMKNDYTSMRISVLPDQSVSLTISQDPAESAKIREHKETASGSQSSAGGSSGKTVSRPARKSVGDIAKSGTYIFRFNSIIETAASCRILENCRGLASSLYFVSESGFYYLVISKDADADEDYDSTVLRINEFADMVSCSDMTLAYIREHCDCILRRRAVQQISELYS